MKGLFDFTTFVGLGGFPFVGAPVYTIGTEVPFLGVQSQWERIPKRLNASREVEFTDWAWNTWTFPQFTVEDFHRLKVYEGIRLSSFSSNDIDNRNQFRVYTDAILETPVNTLQVGRRATSTTIRFRVKVT